MEVVVHSPTEVYQLSKENNLKTLPFCIPIFEDFIYFSPILIQMDMDEGLASNYFVAIENKLIRGILKLGFCEKNKDVRVVEYTDIHKRFQRQGIATKLYQALNDWAKGKPITIVGTSLSKDGKVAKLYNLRSKILVDVQNYDTYVDFEKSNKS